jgi:phage terminase large subunit-like protein
MLSLQKPEPSLRRLEAAAWLLETVNQNKASGQRTPWRSIARPEQLPPDGHWLVWLLLAGRGFGKTRTGAELVREWKENYSRIGIIAPTTADGRDICIEGESGLRACCLTGEIEKWNRSLGEIVFSNGSQAKLFTSEEPDRLRGPQHMKLWCEELGAWKYPRNTWDMAMFGLRLGDSPQAVVTTTPRPIDVIRQLLDAPTTHVTRGTTYANRANLAPAFFEQVVSRYEGTRLGRQELNAEVLEDMPGALWKRGDIDNLRVTQHPELVRVVVAIDPSTTSKETSDEAGVVAVGKGVDGHGYVLEDATLRGSPSQWGSAAVTAYHKHKADRIVGEGNNGGEMVELVVRSVPNGNDVAYRMVMASRGKATRAEPTSANYEQGRMHHVGFFPELEDEMCNWVPGVGTSPNRVDALVWAVTELGIVPGGQGFGLGIA